MTKEQVAEALNEIGTLLELQGENVFRANAYHHAAKAVLELSGDLRQMVADGSIRAVPGIGASVADKIRELVTTGALAYLDELRAAVPRGLVDILRVPGLGPKKVKALYDQLHIDSLEKLKTACTAGQVATLKGFGAKTQQKILEGLTLLEQMGQRVRLDQALALGQALLEQIRTFPEVVRCELCGSLRRRKETCADLDILASSSDPEPIMARFVQLPQVIQILAHGPSKSSVRTEMYLHGDKVVMQADLRVVHEEQYPFGLLHFTGSKEHNVRLRQRAIDRGLTLNEYALANAQTSIPCQNEEEIYAALGLPFIPPELREDTGEIEAAEAGTLPVLVTPSDLRGVFHNHTLYSDGTASLEAMALAAKNLGFEYFGVGDHSQSLTVAHGLPPSAVRKQWAEIERLNRKLHGIHIFRGTEVDILDDGTLDYPDELLAGFDYVVASVHTRFGLPEAAMTARVCKALAHPAVTMLGHATGRLLLRREGYKINLDEVLKVAAQHGKMIEINAQPSRLDLDWRYVKQAKAMGIPIVINPDAHSVGELAFYRFGVDVARRGWLTKNDIFNTRSYTEVKKELARRKRLWTPS
ncbi:MAG: DNA polymerase/3'-5' exonuclease PolX [Gemmataceae bacterium]|nr:DNA polymerase/3'-5' exonuclease PolX [Gemmata sp.]MDW8198305.1 DNA polymerase/3'-5' exonuclease PolX [Gemmataceae bacterium]